jgi:acyl-CoA reductase-like NAD-dependent aldehyde dehydrogenase
MSAKKRSVAKLSVDNPATGRTEVEIETTGAGEIEALCRRAVRAGDAVASLTVAERAAICTRFLERVEADADEIAHDVTRQMGKPIAEARAEVRTMIDRARYMIGIAEAELGVELLPERAGLERYIEHLPVGVVLDIAAWNYPLLIAVNVVVPAVLAGNAVILKHSSRTPLCGARFADTFAAAGAPCDAVLAVVADHAVTAALIARPEVGYVSFTGSVEGGREVSRAAAGRFIDVGLELGGKDAAYVRADCELATTVTNVAEGAFYNAGQSCCAIERVYVQRPLYDRFVDALCEEAKEWRPGAPLDEATKLGPMAQPSAPATVAAQIDDAAARGARVLTGGNITRVADAGRYFEATVVADATHEMTLMTEETFGPVVAVCAVEDDEEAVALMNDSRYGLTASIWTRDVAAAKAVGARLQVGTVFLNRCDYLDPALPWSGWKDSGVGVTLSRLGFARMTRTRGFHLRPTSE